MSNNAEQHRVISWERTFGVRVRDHRTARGWTQDDLARRMAASGYPMHQTTVAKLEKGVRPTSIGEAAALATIFALPVSRLFEISDDKIHLQLAGLAATLEMQTDELVRLERRRSELTAERVSTEAQLRELRERAIEEEQAREVAKRNVH